LKQEEPETERAAVEQQHQQQQPLPLPPVATMSSWNNNYRQYQDPQTQSTGSDAQNHNSQEQGSTLMPAPSEPGYYY